MTQAARRTLNERRADDLRLDIARTAMEIFVEDGDTSATVERIAEAAGVAPRTFYRHFAVKEDVVLPLFRRSSEVIAASLSATEDDEELVEALVRAFRSSLNDRRLSRKEKAFLGIMMTSPAYRMRWLEVDDLTRDAVAELLARRWDLSNEPFLHHLSAQLIVNTAREVFEQWLSTEASAGVDVLLRRGFSVVIWGLDGCLNEGI